MQRVQLEVHCSTEKISGWKKGWERRREGRMKAGSSMAAGVLFYVRGQHQLSLSLAFPFRLFLLLKPLFN